MKVTVETRDGQHISLNVVPGMSLMHAMREHGIDEVIAICGGFCSCATCHVFVDKEFSGRVPAASEDEIDLLDSSPSRSESSRLSCQIMLTPELDGISVAVAPED